MRRGSRTRASSSERVAETDLDGLPVEARAGFPVAARPEHAEHDPPCFRQPPGVGSREPVHEDAHRGPGRRRCLPT